MGVPTFAYVIGMKTVKKPVVLELVYCSNLQGRTVVNPGNVMHNSLPSIVLIQTKWLVMKGD